jgi:hypothetical protein
MIPPVRYPKTARRRTARVPTGGAARSGAELNWLERALDDVLARRQEDPSRWVMHARRLLGFTEIDDVLSRVETVEARICRRRSRRPWTSAKRDARRRGGEQGARHIIRRPVANI